MSDFIDVISPDASKNVDELNSKLTTMIKNVATLNNMKVGTPSGADTSIKKLTADYVKQEKVIADLQIKLERLAQTQARSKIVANQLEQSNIRLEKSIEAKNKALDREQAKLKTSENVYNKVQAKLNALSNEYKSLAVRKELSGKLTDKESQRYDFLQGKIQKYDATLKAVDATMGKYQRNVGNYGMAFNPLSNSINQLTREMPAFANSVQTGFMAISNNLPIFFDAIQQANAEIKLLRANGEETPTLFQKLTSSVLSWGTALSIGVTLLTVFGDEIVDAIFQTKAKAKADEEAKKAVEEKNKAEQDYIDTMRNAGSEEISRSQILLANASNVNIKMRDRLSAIKELKERYPDYLGHLTTEQILSGKTAEAEEKLNEALMKRGIAIALQGKLTEKYNELTGALLKINTIQTKSNALTNDEIKLGQKIGVSNSKLLKDKQLISNLSLANANREKKSIEEQIKSIFDLYNQYSPYLSAVREAGDAQQKNAEETQKSMTNSEVAFKANISALESQLETIDRLNPAYDLMNSLLQIQKELYEQLFGTKKDNENVDDALLIKAGQMAKMYDELAKKAQEYALALRIAEKAGQALNKGFDEGQKKINDYLLTFSSSFLGDAGFSNLFKILNKEIFGFGQNFAVTFEAIAESAQEAFNFISEMSNANFQNEYENLEKQKNIALLFAGDSATAREEIERQAEQRQKEIRRREFQAQKQLALFNIAINTAQGIVSALASTPPNVPLSIAIGAIGLVQAGVVASRQIPAFWKGTDNAPEGWALTQEKGREIITDKSGKIKSYGNDKGATMTYLNKGDKVKTASETIDFLMFNNDLSAMLSNNQIGMPIVNVESNKTDLTPVVNAINNKESFQLSIDENGFRKSIRNGHSMKELIQRRTGFKGFGV